MPRSGLQVDLESGVRVTCDVGYLCADFSLPMALRSRLRPHVRDRQTDRRQTSNAHHRLGEVSVTAASGLRHCDLNEL